MMTTLDRMFFLTYIRNYLIFFTALNSIYVILDLFTNLDDFSKQGMVDNILHMFRYYSAQIALIFDKLSEAITLLAAMFTVAWMQRSNELLPQLSAGISTRRVLRPVLIGCAITLTFGPLNQEIIIPAMADELQVRKDDPRQENAREVKGCFDSTGVHFEGMQAFRKDHSVKVFFVTFPDSNPTHLSAWEAEYKPPSSEEYSGGWELRRTTTNPDPLKDLPPHVVRLSEGKYFIYSREIDFDAVTREPNWYTFASTPKLLELLASPDSRRQPGVAVNFHLRLTRPIVGAILIFMGLSVILRDQNRHVFINAGLCIVLCGIFYAAKLGCKYMGENDFLSPAMAAWLPVLIFGPITFALFDAVHT